MRFLKHKWLELSLGTVLKTTLVALAICSLTQVGLAATPIKFNLPPVITKIAVSDKKIPIIIDTDMAQDDWLAINYVLAHPSANVLAVTVANTGESGGPIGVDIAKGLNVLFGIGNVPVDYGPDKPLKGDNAFPLEWRKDIATVHNIILPKGKCPKSPGKAVDLLIKTINSSDDKVTILALGPLTNLALAFEKEPKIVSNIDKIVIMGGAVDVEGNVNESTPSIPNKTAEWNLFVDPVAADKVFKSGAPIYLVPLDACNHVPINDAFYQKVAAYHPTTAAKFVLHIMETRKQFMNDGNWYFWDPLAATLLFHPELAKNEELNIKMVTQPGLDFGRTIRDKDGAKMLVAMHVNNDDFARNFLAILNHTYLAVPQSEGKLEIREAKASPSAAEPSPAVAEK